MKKPDICLSLLVFAFPVLLSARQLTPGFDKEEYMELIRISIQTVKDSVYAAGLPAPRHFKMIYQSNDIGLDNSWDLWANDLGIAAISLRGTTAKQESWLENVYAAMVPAKGKLKLSKEGDTFEYHLADNPNAGVHVGWLIGMAFLSREILPKIDSLYQAGTKDFLIMGHSQGGAIAYLLTAHVYHQQNLGKLPADIRFKTYCSAGPKPGNLYFAYDYETLTQNGWAFNVVNAVDWVPEVPISIQTLDDFNNTNPFRYAKTAIKMQKFPNKIALKHIYNRLNKPTRRARKNYEKYLGQMTSRMVSKRIEGLEVPEYLQSNNYVRTGNYIVLQPDEDYNLEFPEDPVKIFNHHPHKNYMYLTERLKEQQ